MTAIETIAMAEEKIAGIQSQLSTVESVLERAEHVVVAGEKAGGTLRRLLKLVLLISVVAAIAMVVRKFMNDGCPFSKGADEEPAIIAEGEDEADAADDAVS